MDKQSLNEPRATDIALRVASRTHKPSDRTSFDPPNFSARERSRNESYHSMFEIQSLGSRDGREALGSLGSKGQRPYISVTSRRSERHP